MKTNILAFSFLAAGAVFSPAVSAQNETPYGTTLAGFEFVGKIPVEISLPTVIEVPVTDPAFQEGDFAVFEETTKKFQPAIFGERAKKIPVTISVSADQAAVGSVLALTDGTADFAEFPVSAEQGKNSVTLDLTATRPVTASGLLLELEPFVALPKTAEVSVIDEAGGERILLAKTALLDRAIRFPKTTSGHYRIRFEYGQPLRIREISFFNEEALQIDGRYVRFLARPGERYSIYFSADRNFRVPTGEQSNLSDDRDVKRIGGMKAENNAFFVPADVDDDGVRDTLDNCVNDDNADQKDENGNGRGDVCDDYDKDGIINSKDNCPAHPNRNQQDTDGDGKGDICDGEESRITESQPWLPWAAMGMGILVVVGLFMATVRGQRDK